MNDFRKDFKNFDDMCLVNIEEYGQLMGVSPAGMAMKRHAGELAADAGAHQFERMTRHDTDAEAVVDHAAHRVQPSHVDAQLDAAARC